MNTAPRIQNADDLWNHHDPSYRSELLHGEFRKLPFRGYIEGCVSMRLAVPMHEFVRTHRMGAVVAAGTGFVIVQGPDTVRAPSAAFIRRERIPPAGVSA